MFNLDSFLKSSPISVNATNIRIQDMRSGEVMTKTIYRPGKTIAFQTLAKELCVYGYVLLWVDDTPGDVPGRMDWSDIFDAFSTQEEE